MTATVARKLVIDIWSDVMCPWCLVGWGNLSQALERLDGEIEAELRWHAFELNPDMPEAGEDRIAHVARKYGRTAAQSKSVQERMRQAAEAAGVSLDYRGANPAPSAMMWNTFAAHKLLLWTLDTRGAAKQTELKLALFDAHFHRRERIGERDVLLEVIRRVGLDPASATAALDDERLSRRVRTEERRAMEMDITGVPAMVVAGKVMIPGAQSAEVYVDVLRRVARRAVERAPA